MSKSDEILDVAEGFARERGYNGFSFRDIATKVGIKSASVHYHFPTKGDLGEALARRYADRFFSELGEPTAVASARRRFARYVGTFRKALTVDKKMCLCGMLGAEVASLPPAVVAETDRFFTRNIDWLQAAFPGGAKRTRRRAIFILATLEGAMVIARTFHDAEAFDATTAELASAVLD